MLTAVIYQEAVRDVLQREFGQRKHAAKILARMAGATVRAAQNWLDGACAPNGAALINLEANCAAVEAEIARLKAMARREPQ